MNIEEQKVDAFKKVKDLVVKHNLDISDSEIKLWIEEESNKKSLKDYLLIKAEEQLDIINKNLKTKFTTSSSLNDILSEIRNQWDKKFL